MTAQPIQSLDDDVNTLLDLQERRDDLNNQIEAIKARLAHRGVGNHHTTTGAVVVITNPNRQFNLDRAWAMLTPEQQALCTSPDARKVKSQLAPVLAEDCMEPGTGAVRVSVK